MGSQWGVVGFWSARKVEDWLVWKWKDCRTGRRPEVFEKKSGIHMQNLCMD